MTSGYPIREISIGHAETELETITKSTEKDGAGYRNSV